MTKPLLWIMNGIILVVAALACFPFLISGWVGSVCKKISGFHRHLIIKHEFDGDEEAYERDRWKDS